MKMFRLLLLLLSMLTIMLGFLAIIGKVHVFLGIFCLLIDLVLLSIFIYQQKTGK